MSVCRKLSYCFFIERLVKLLPESWINFKENWQNHNSRPCWYLWRILPHMLSHCLCFCIIWSQCLHVHLMYNSTAHLPTTVNTQQHTCSASTWDNEQKKHTLLLTSCVSFHTLTWTSGVQQHPASWEASLSNFQSGWFKLTACCQILLHNSSLLSSEHHLNTFVPLKQQHDAESDRFDLTYQSPTKCNRNISQSESEHIHLPLFSVC